MIPAVEALQLPTAQLTPDELAAADKLEVLIEEHVHTKMTRQGFVFEAQETRGTVIADVMQRIKSAGYQVQPAQIVEAHPLNKAQQTLVGFRLSVSPTDESYRAAARAVLS